MVDLDKIKVCPTCGQVVERKPSKGYYKALLFGSLFTDLEKEVIKKEMESIYGKEEE